MLGQASIGLLRASLTTSLATRMPTHARTGSLVPLGGPACKDPPRTTQAHGMAAFPSAERPFPTASSTGTLSAISPSCARDG